MGKSKGSGTGEARRPKPKNTYWREDVLWGCITVDGEKLRWSLRTSDAAVAKRRVAAKRQQLVAAAFFGDDRKTYEQTVTAWGGQLMDHVGAATAKRYAVSLKQIAPHLLGLFIDQINKRTILDLVDSRRKSTASIATIRRDLTALSSVLAYAEDQDWREGNPALDRLRRLKERRDPIVLPDAADIATVVSRAPGMLSSLIQAADLTGCRQSELATAKRTHLDLKLKQLTVIGKGNKLRTINLDARAVALLASLPPFLGKPWLFWHDAGAPYRNIASRFAAIVKVAAKNQAGAHKRTQDFRPFPFHDLRHHFAVNWLKSGKSIYDLQHHLGHTSVKTTEMYLKYLTPDEERRVKQTMTQPVTQ